MLPIRSLIRTIGSDRSAPAIFVAISFLMWATWTVRRDIPPSKAYVTLTNINSDHFSHMNRVRAFFYDGLDIYRDPLSAVGSRLDDEQRARLPADIRATAGATAKGAVFVGRGFSLQKPFIASWVERPAMHPPGDILILGPVAALYHNTNISFTTANRWLIVTCLFYGHLGIYFFLRALLSHAGLGPVGFLVVVVVYSQVVHWALEGFYECADLAPLVLAGGFLARRRYLAAAVAYSAAAVIHFRVFFLAPWAIAAALGIVQTRAWRQWRRWDFFALGVASLLSFATLGVFYILWPTLKSLPVDYSPLSPEKIDHNARFMFGVVVVVAGIAFLAARSWLDLAVLVWMTFMFSRLREAFDWDIVSTFGWFAGPLPRSASSRPLRAMLVRDARFLFIAYAAHAIFKNSLMPDWLVQVHSLIFKS